MSTFITSFPTNTQTPIPNSISTSPSKPSHKLYKSSSQKFKEIEEQYINYAVTHNTKYSDLERIENQYHILSIQRFNIYNKNKSRIAKLQKLNQQLSTQIQTSLIKYLPLSIEEFLLQYNNEINRMKRLVKIKEHEIETYKTLYNRLYYKNILLKKRIQSEQENADVYTSQHIQYRILKNHALLSFHRQFKKYEKMKNYDEVSFMEMKRDLLQKAKLANTLDYQIDLIKNEVKNTENKLKKYTTLGQNIQSKIILQNQKYEVYYNDYLWIKKMFVKEFTEFNKILSILHVKDVNVLINKFNLLRKEYQHLLTQFKLCNNDVTHLNNTLTKLETSLSDIKQKIIAKQNSIRLASTEQSINENTYIILTKSKLEELRIDLTQSGILCDKKRFVLQSVMLFLLKNIRKLFYQGECISLSNNSNDYLSNLMNIITNTNKELTITYEHIGSKMLIELCFIMRKLFDCYFHLFFNSMNTIIIDHIRDQPEFYLNKEININEIYNEEYIKLYQQYVMFSIKQIEDKNRIMKRKEKQLLSSLRTMEDKSQIQNKRIEISKGVLYRNFIEYLGNDMEQKGHNDIKNSKKKKSILVTINDYNSKINKKDNSMNFYNKSFVCSHPRQIMKIMDKYKNYLVVDDNEYYNNKYNTFNSGNVTTDRYSKIKNRYFNSIKPKSITLSKSNSSSLLQFHIKHRNILNNSNTSILSTSLNSRNQLHQSFYPKIQHYYENEEYDNDEDEENEMSNNICEENIISKSQNKILFNSTRKNYELYKNNPEMAIIHKRQNDLRMLDLKYGNGMTTYQKGDNADFSEAFYNFEKKYLKKSTVQSSYSIANLKKGNSVSKSNIQTLNDSTECMNKNKNYYTTLSRKNNHIKNKRVCSVAIKKKLISNITMNDSNNSNSNSNSNTFISNTNYNKHKLIKKSSSFSFLINDYSKNKLIFK